MPGTPVAQGPGEVNRHGHKAGQAARGPAVVFQAQLVQRRVVPRALCTPRSPPCHAHTHPFPWRAVGAVTARGALQGETNVRGNRKHVPFQHTLTRVHKCVHSSLCMYTRPFSHSHTLRCTQMHRDRHTGTHTDTHTQGHRETQMGHTHADRRHTHTDRDTQTHTQRNTFSLARLHTQSLLTLADI